MNGDYQADMPDFPWRAQVTAGDGEMFDITRELAVMYDAIVGSMDWGSGFLDREDVEALFRVATLCGFEVGEYAVEKQSVILTTALGTPLSMSSPLTTLITKDGPVRRYHIRPTNEGKASKLQVVRYVGPHGRFGDYEVLEEIELPEKIPTYPGQVLGGTLE